MIVIVVEWGLGSAGQSEPKATGGSGGGIFQTESGGGGEVSAAFKLQAGGGGGGVKGRLVLGLNGVVEKMGGVGGERNGDGGLSMTTEMAVLVRGGERGRIGTGRDDGGVGERRDDDR
ncbi:hypothetical protein ACFE04_007863 [Oxalis oulophora]